MVEQQLRNVLVDHCGMVWKTLSKSYTQETTPFTAGKKGLSFSQFWKSVLRQMKANFVNF